MSRWKPDARGRLEAAAYQLFRDRGYDQTTVADIAQRAKLTERTFFRHYGDKREVIFGSANAFNDELRRGLAEADADLPAIDAARFAVERLSRRMHGRLPLARERQRIIAAHPDLQERELQKRSSLVATAVEGLRERGISPSIASLAAEMGVAVFYISFSRWLNDSIDRELIDVVCERFDELKVVAAGTEVR